MLASYPIREADAATALKSRSPRADIWIRSGRGWLGSNYQPGLASIIVPAFNAEETLLETLQSVYAQSFRAIELIVVDDGSTDNSAAVTQRFAAQVVGDASFMVRLVSQENGGAPNARNNGAKMSVGEFVAFLDADDTLHSEKIARQVAVLQDHPDWDFCYGPVAILEDVNRRSYGNRALDWRDAALRQLGWPFFSTPGPVFRRHFLDKVGCWDETLKACQDWEYHSRMVMLQPKFGWVEDAVAYYRRARDPERRVSVPKVKRSDTPERALRGREGQLRSLLAHAPPDLLRSSDFRRTASWEVMRHARSEANAGMMSSALKLYADASSLGRGTVVSPLAALALKLCQADRVRRAGWLVSVTEWTFYRFTGVISRLRRFLGKLSFHGSG